MKIKKLKKQDFIMYFNEFVVIEDGFTKNCRTKNWYDSEFESYIAYINGELSLYAHWDYDNGLYTESGYTKVKLAWKDLKYNLQRKQKKENLPWQSLFNGKCDRCGCNLNDENFKLELNFNLYFERDFYYCNDCKNKQVDDYVAFMEAYDE